MYTKKCVNNQYWSQGAKLSQNFAFPLQKIPSEMEVAPRYTVDTVDTVDTVGTVYTVGIVYKFYTVDMV